MKATNWMAGFAVGMSLLAGCIGDGSDKPDESPVKGGPDGKAEAWGSSDNPAMFNSNLEYRVSELPAQGEAHGQRLTGGVDERTLDGVVRRAVAGQRRDRSLDDDVDRVRRGEQRPWLLRVRRRHGRKPECEREGGGRPHGAGLATVCGTIAAPAISSQLSTPP